MAKLEHQDLKMAHEAFAKKKKAGFFGYDENKQDYDDIYTKYSSILDNIRDNHKPETGIGYNSDPIIKIETDGEESGSIFHTDLEKAGMKPLFRTRIDSSTEKRSEWILTTEDPTFTKLKENIKKRADKDEPTMVDRITSISKRKPEEKIGHMLKIRPLDSSSRETIMVQIYTGSGYKKKIIKLEEDFKKLVEQHGFKILDTIKSENLNMVMIESNDLLLKKIMEYDLVMHVEHLVKFDITLSMAPPEKLQPVIKRITAARIGILVMDTGVRGHPLLQSALSEKRLGLEDRRHEDKMYHGTAVAGYALYGNFDKIIRNKKADSKFDIYSAKIFWEGNNGPINSDRHYMNVVKDCVYEASKLNGCRVINISFGDEYDILYDGMTQPVFSTLIDDLATEYPDIVFTISAGNVKKEYPEDFLKYLKESRLDIRRIASPASSIHALVVGSVRRRSDDVFDRSSFTKIGPGINQMIKPDLVEVGGEIDDEIPGLNTEFGKGWITSHLGTSFSSPIVANHIANLMDKFPYYSRNKILSLFFSSCSHPNSSGEIREIFPRITGNSRSSEIEYYSYTHGFGMTNIDNAMYSDNDRVVLIHEGSIMDKQYQYFEIWLPEKFVDKNDNGIRTITVSLVFDPKTNRYSRDYFGTRLEFNLYHNVTLEEMLDDSGSARSSKKQITLVPTPSIRTRSPHQFGFKKFKKIKINTDKPLILVVTCKDKWKRMNTNGQEYAVSVTLEHQGNIDLYTQIKEKNRIQQPTRISSI